MRNSLRTYIEHREVSLLYYRDGSEVRIGDSVRHHATADAVVETIVEGEEVARWSFEMAMFLILCDQCGRVLIEPGSHDWEDVVFVARAN